MSSNCSISPSSAALTAGGQTNVTVSVATGVSASSQLASTSIVLSGLGVGAIVPTMILVFRRRRFSHRLGMLSLFGILAIAASGIASCGGSSSGGNSNATPPGTYTIVLTATSGSQTVQQSLALTVQ
jgi:hypothetical protein